ncbi:TetR family transcriptional regulator [Nonomuraea terrae]|uniref:TetR family transcriptional regulator n=1 Tax=Nonomuraea terrae TaxID=2530383 RepID=UPI0037BC6FF9
MGGALPYDRLRGGGSALMRDRPPARSRRTTERKSVRQRAILDTSEGLPAQKGYDVMTVGDVAQGAGITRGALYFSFWKWPRRSWPGPLRLWERSRATAEADDPRQAIAAALPRLARVPREVASGIFGLRTQGLISAGLTGARIEQISALGDRRKFLRFRAT